MKKASLPLLVNRFRLLTAIVISAPGGILSHSSVSPVPCPCANTELCGPLSASQWQSGNGSAVIFSDAYNSSKLGSTWDFTKIHAWAPFHNLGPNYPNSQQLFCKAHKQNVPVLTWGYESWNGSSCPITDFYSWALANDSRVYDSSAITEWAVAAADCAVSRGFDGILLDMEGIGGPPLGPASMLDAIFFAVCQLKGALSARLPQARIFWTADTGPYFPVANLTSAGCVDVWLDMAYDWCIGQEEHSALRNRANSPWAFIDQGPQSIVETWMGPGFEVPGHRLGVVFPWYGCEFSCENDDSSGTYSDYNGCPVATLVPLSPTLDEVIDQWLPNASGPVIFNYTTVTKYLNAANLASNFSNIGDKSDISRDAKATKKLLSEQHQVWWDDAETLSIKYDTALRAGVEFVGVWTVNMVDDHPEIAKALWSVLPHRKHNRSEAKMKP